MCVLCIRDTGTIRSRHKQRGRCRDEGDRGRYRDKTKQSKADDETRPLEYVQVYFHYNVHGKGMRMSSCSVTQ